MTLKSLLNTLYDIFSARQRENMHSYITLRCFFFYFSNLKHFKRPKTANIFKVSAFWHTILYNAKIIQVPFTSFKGYFILMQLILHQFNNLFVSQISYEFLCVKGDCVKTYQFREYFNSALVYDKKTCTFH